MHVHNFSIVSDLKDFFFFFFFFFFNFCEQWNIHTKKGTVKGQRNSLQSHVSRTFIHSRSHTNMVLQVRYVVSEIHFGL